MSNDHWFRSREHGPYRVKTACLIYKEMILSLSDYADAMVKSGQQGDVSL